MKLRLLTLALALCATPAGLRSVQAYDGCGSGYGYGWGYDYGALYNALDFRVPYFAAHPPVYYSYPVPRPYGYSPFAYPPYVLTPEILGDVEPATIINPYVPSSQQESSAPEDRVTQQQAVQPLVIDNPYFDKGPQLVSTGQ